MKHNVGIVGTGKFAGHHAMLWQSIDGVEVKGVYGGDPQRLKTCSQKWGIEGYDDYQRLLNDVDIVDIVNANHLHADFALQAVEKVRCVIVEKPLDISYEKACRVAEKAVEHGCLGSVISQYRFQRCYQQVKEFLDAGACGEVYGARVFVSWPRKNEYFDAGGGWRKDADRVGGGVLIHQCIHFIDLLHWFFGKALTVTGSIPPGNHDRDKNIEDIFAGMIGFEKGMTAQIYFSTRSCYHGRVMLEIFGQRRNISVCGNHVFTTVSDNFLKTIAFNIVPYMRHLLGPKENASALLNRQFLDILSALDEGKTPSVNLEDGLCSVRTVTGLYQSAAEGRQVQMRDVREVLC